MVKETIRLENEGSNLLIERRLMRSTRRWLPLCAGLIAALLPITVTAAPKESAPAVRVSEDSKALLPLIVARTTSERTRRAALALAQYLERISGGRFEVKEGDGTSGIAIGLSTDFPALRLKELADVRGATHNEDYLLRSHERGLQVIGVSDLAVEHAVWDLLYRLGHRQFFPGETWEVTPRNPNLRIAVNALEQPAYYSRRIWYGYGPWDYSAKPYADWCTRNRATAGIELVSGHAYDQIIRRHEAEFQKHPEYLALVNGKRQSSKFCISNPGLRKLVVDYALAYCAAKPSAQSISLEPSDGGGWCECEQCKAMGSVSDRAVTLANDVAAAVTAKYGDKYVGMYAYNQHSPPPTIKVHPHVVIGVATAFIKGGYTVDQLLQGWQRQGATLGIREYYSVHPWDRDLPRAARGARPTYLKSTIPQFHAEGARFLSAESSDNWGPNGLGYYLAARMMWDIREAGRVDELIADFLDKAFGPAREPMQGFYRLINGPKAPPLCDDLVGRMARFLADAWKRTDDPAIRKRLDDLVLYTRYVELYLDYSTSQGPARQQAFEALIRHAYRMRQTMMIHVKGLYRDLPARDRSVKVPAEATWNVPEGKNPWKSSAPFTRSELDGFVAAAIANRKLLDFEPVSFSEKLVPASRLKLPDVTGGTRTLFTRGDHTYFTWVEKAPATLTLPVKAGLIYQTSGNAKFALLPNADPELKASAQVEAPPDRQEHSLELKTPFAGLHRLQLSDRTAGTSITWPDGLALTVPATADAPAVFSGRWNLYFYVPKGTSIVGGFASGPGEIRDGAGKMVHKFEAKPGYFSVPVPPGQDGQLWKFHNAAGHRVLLTVPPYLARSGKELLLPAEVVERDAGKTDQKK
jgi:hypothetical protein